MCTFSQFIKAFIISKHLVHHVPSFLNISGDLLLFLFSLYIYFGTFFFQKMELFFRKVSNTFFLWKPGGFQWSALAWGNLEPSYACVNFYCLSNTPVDGKQYLSEVVFSALIRFLLYTTSTDHKVKQSPKSTTGIFSITYVMLCGARDQTCGQQVIASPSRQYFSTFLAFDSDFFLAKNQTMRLIRFPALQVFLFFFLPVQRSDTFLTMKIQQEH